jgi:hypothetical protein
VPPGKGHFPSADMLSFSVAMFVSRPRANLSRITRHRKERRRYLLCGLHLRVLGFASSDGYIILRVEWNEVDFLYYDH